MRTELHLLDLSEEGCAFSWILEVVGGGYPLASSFYTKCDLNYKR